MIVEYAVFSGLFSWLQFFFIVLFMGGARVVAMDFASLLTLFDHQTIVLMTPELLRFAQLWSRTQPCSRLTSVVSACTSSGLIFCLFVFDWLRSR